MSRQPPDRGLEKRFAHLFALLFCGFYQCAVARGADRPSLNLRADRVLVEKNSHTLTLLSHGRAIQTYKVALRGNPKAAKTSQGDHKTPEGDYVLDRRNQHSHFYRSIHISYPHAEDRAHARKLGSSPGGDVMLHGVPNGYGWIGAGHRARDWTDECIAETNEEMDEIWRTGPMERRSKFVPEIPYSNRTVLFIVEISNDRVWRFVVRRQMLFPKTGIRPRAGEWGMAREVALPFPRRSTPPVRAVAPKSSNTRVENNWHSER